jgi:hypothetical protein
MHTDPLTSPACSPVPATAGFQRASVARASGSSFALQPRSRSRVRFITARAGNRRFGLLSALCAPIQTPYKPDLLVQWKTLRALNRPGRARTEHAAVEAPLVHHRVRVVPVRVVVLVLRVREAVVVLRLLQHLSPSHAPPLIYHPSYRFPHKNRLRAPVAHRADQLLVLELREDRPPAAPDAVMPASRVGAAVQCTACGSRWHLAVAGTERD